MLGKSGVRASVYTVFGVRCSSGAWEDHRDANFSNRHNLKIIHSRNAGVVYLSTIEEVKGEGTRKMQEAGKRRKYSE